MAELPLVVVNVQRAGPSTGMPTKTEQSDLMQAMFGRNGESPVVVLAPRGPADCFRTAYDAVRIALTHMVPVVILSDGYIANGAEPWRVPEPATLPAIEVPTPQVPAEGEPFLPYDRDPETLARPWATPGMPGLMHRIGGLEKEELTGNVSYVPKNHQRMTDLRAEKVARVANDLHPTRVFGDEEGVLVIGWGSTFGSLREATERCRTAGHKVGHVQLRNLNPFPPDLGDVLSRYDKVLCAELNMGQLHKLIRCKYLIDAVPLCKVEGQPFKIREVESALVDLIQDDSPTGVCQ